jgi:hypothetical protein
MGLCETVFVNVAPNITLMSVNQTFAIPAYVVLKDDITFVLPPTYCPATSTATSRPSRSTGPNPCQERFSLKAKIHNVKNI